MWSILVIKVGVAYVGVVCIPGHLKEELAWAIDKWLQVNSNLKQLYH